MAVELQAAYILHSRPYRENSLLIDALTQYHGRVALVAKGARKSKTGQRQCLQAFTPIKLSWLGKSSLKTLTSVESLAPAFDFKHNYLYSGFYANELLSYLLVQDDPAEGVFELYQNLLIGLAKSEELEPCLRKFEFSLLNVLGYGIDFSACFDSGEEIQSDSYYHFIPDKGFVPILNNEYKKKDFFLGQQLLAVANHNFSRKEYRICAKLICRLAFEPLLQGKVLKSRELFKTN